MIFPIAMQLLFGICDFYVEDLDVAETSGGVAAASSHGEGSFWGDLATIELCRRAFTNLNHINGDGRDCSCHRGEDDTVRKMLDEYKISWCDPRQYCEIYYHLDGQTSSFKILFR